MQETLTQIIVAVCVVIALWMGIRRFRRKKRSRCNCGCGGNAPALPCDDTSACEGCSLSSVCHSAKKHG